MSKKTLIAIVLLIYPISNLFSAEKGSPTYLIMGGFSGGLMNVNYDDINYQLKKFYNIRGINYYFPLGVEGMVIYKNRMIINTSFLLSYYRRESAIHRSEFSFLRPTILAKMGITPFPGRQNIFFPYLGLGLESLQIKTNINYGVKCIDCFFRNSRYYSTYNLVLLYGIEYGTLPIIKNNLFFGIECGGSITLTDNHWKIDGEQGLYFSEFVRFDPGGFFIRVNILFPIFNKGY